LLPLFIRCYYHGKHQEFLVVQRNDVRTKDNLGILLDDPRNIGFHTTVIAPTGLDIAAGDLRRVERAEKVDLNARHYVHYVIGICREQIYQASTIVMNDRKKTIRFDREGGASYLAVNQYLLDQIGQVVSDMREDTVSRSSDQSAGNRTRPT
jgi:hypothetical protein